uniref:CSC1/OSCA1-like cytosolic domain-containing protein n=1 Tax=Pseudo-nitzschia australis TaxID=44445 RepID=A0A7S4APN5_9STRA|mmetsp:Transcript_27578/g.60715  ORF Transcript_27578/g.60715 Transcript_27578/m.60715 type:complete len:1018 (+) Transcript_27578:186-3239(+)
MFGLFGKGQGEEKAPDATPTSLMTGVLGATNNSTEGRLDDVSVVSSHKVDGKHSNQRKVKSKYNRVSFAENNEDDSKIDFLNDDIKEMTYGRRIALSLMNKSWYYPMAGTNSDDSESDTADEENNDDGPLQDFDKNVKVTKPCLRKGWAFFEHQALYRYLVLKDQRHRSTTNVMERGDRKFDKADAGEDEKPSRLYPWFTLPHKQLGDFGLGVGLYFSSLRIFILITFICGLISLPNIMYFASEDYDPVKANGVHRNITFSNFLEIGSATCHTTEWVPCLECECRVSGDSGSQQGRFPQSRCSNSTLTDGTSTPLVFALKNECDGAKWELAATNYATVIFMLLAVMVLGWIMRKEEVSFDEDEQTAQDYSILITNPPTDAKDPEEWRRFFYENLDGARVTVCTCAVDNDILVQTLVERRECFQSIQNIQPGISMDFLDLARVSAETERDRSIISRYLALLLPGIPEYFSRIITLKAKVEGLAQLEFPVTNVFVTFETEEHQRHVLKNLSLGSWKTGPIDGSGDASALSNPKHLFRKNLVLNVIEPEEPNTIRWQDLNAGSFQHLKELTATTLLTLVMIVGDAIVIYRINNINVLWCAYAITASGMIFPIFAKLMTNFMESHQSESSKQASLYFKIVLFRWVTTAIVIFVITPFTDTLTAGKQGVIAQVYALFISDMSLTNLVAVLDPVGHFQRHFLAPRAKTQDCMDILFQGNQYELAERYTDMTKILLLCLFFCSIFPSSFFICAISLTLKYYCDRFNLTRTWKKAPQIGPSISKISRLYFFSLAVCLMAISCSYYWTAFPFDNLCPMDDDWISDNPTINTSYDGNFILSQSKSGKEITTINVDSSTILYRFCNMNFLDSHPNVAFPFVPAINNENLDPQDYMTDEQLIYTAIFGWSAFAILVIICIKHVIIFYGKFKRLTKSDYQSVGETQGIDYSDVTARSAYIPQVTSPTFPYPLIACNIDGIDHDLIDFTDPDRTHKYYDLSMDAKKLLAALKIENPPGFTIVKSWTLKKND